MPMSEITNVFIKLCNTLETRQRSLRTLKGSTPRGGIHFLLSSLETELAVPVDIVVSRDLFLWVVRAAGMKWGSRQTLGQQQQW